LQNFLNTPRSSAMSKLITVSIPWS